MIKNYLKIALRNLLKHKAFSAINITGLALGIAAFLLILQYVGFETSYDNFHTNGDNIYRLQQNRYNDGQLTTQWAAGAAGIGKLIKDNLPEVTEMAKLSEDNGVFSFGDKKFNEKQVYYAMESFLRIFSYKVTQGKAEGSLAEPFTAAVTESTAKKYFGDTKNAIGKTISHNKERDYKITAVIADPPANTHFKFDILLSYPSMAMQMDDEKDREHLETTFDWDGYFTYILVKPGTDIPKLEKKIQKLVDDKVGKEYKARKEGIEFKLQPMRDIHLYSNYMAEAEANGNGQAVYFLLIIAVFIIIIAWINYINLSTARSVDRAKEVGMRKVMGSFRSQLIAQFMFEALLINIFAIVLGLSLVLTFLPLFNSLTGKEVTFSLLNSAQFWLALLGLFAGGTLLAGLYPAFVMSSFKPITVLKGKFTRSKQGTLLRQTLVIVQFGASVVLMVGTFGVYRQLNYMQNQDIGVKINNVLVLKGPQVLDTATYRFNLKAFKNELSKTAGVDKVVASTSVPGRKINWNAGGITLVGSDKSNQYRPIGIDYNYIDAFGLRIIKGRNFSEEFPGDRKNVLFNEAAMKLIGFNKPGELIGKQIDFWGDRYTVIGIVSNHHQEGLRAAYDAHIYRLIPNTNRYYSVKMQPKQDPATIIKAAEAQWKIFFPGNPFEYFFLDDHYAEQYKADQQFGKTFTLFALLAIVVACLGLLGLASYATTQRTKEIGIRKISGASVTKLLVLLTKDFIKPVLLSFVIALPIAYYLLSQWLQNYAFKTNLSPWLFIAPGILILLTAVITISTQTIRAASANPVKSLRTE